MDYKKMNNKEHLLKFKENILKQLDQTIVNGIESGSHPDYKRSALICYWLKDYNNYLNFEKKFKPNKMKRYKRGDVIKVNFGFNIGSEHGGMHYAIVLDNNNYLNSGVVTVIPLISKDPDKKIYHRDVDLGTGIYEKMVLKIKTITDSLKRELVTAQDYIDSLNKLREAVQNDEGETISEKLSLLRQYTEKVNEVNQKIDTLTDMEGSMNDIRIEIGRMKKGSIAKVEQITTISKMRIFDPKTTRDVLSGIRLSASELDMIDAKAQELFLKHK